MSVKEAHSFGLIPCTLSDSVIDFVLKLAGAAGTAFNANVILLSVSVCDVMSGWPFALNASV